MLSASYNLWSILEYHFHMDTKGQLYYQLVVRQKSIKIDLDLLQGVVGLTNLSSEMGSRVVQSVNSVTHIYIYTHTDILYTPIQGRLK